MKDEIMRERIINESIRSLQQEGLRFSVDTLAERLKISKKTIYKHFPTKEALACAMYERYYAGLMEEIGDILRQEDPVRAEKLLDCYFHSTAMVRREIFNKYCLNGSIGGFALRRHEEVWAAIRPYVCGGMPPGRAAVFRLIVDGAFEKAMDCGADAAEMVKMLREVK